MQYKAMQFETKFNNGSYLVSFNETFTGASVDGRFHEVSWTGQKNGRRLLRVGNRLFKVGNVEKDGRQLTFTLNGSRHRAEVKNEQDLLLEKLGFREDEMSSAGKVQAPMPGKILEIPVNENEEIEQGQPVVILEAMKMENELKAPASGRISVIHVHRGDSVEKNQPLLEIEPRG
ncbi:MAG: biotin/lipoyl-containing protein [Balneolaceae bacterium]